MKFDIGTLIGILKIITGVAVFFVWVVRYDNIKREFDRYGLPKKFRDLIGILKISFTVMLQSADENIVLVGSLGIVILMGGAIITHLKIKNPLKEILPAFAMFSIGLVILGSLFL